MIDEIVAVKRFAENPIVTPDSDDRIGDNINGPSLIRVPDWLPGALGKYYLYFAHHKDSFIRLAYADDLHGPWRVYSPGVISTEEAGFTGHIASPDVHIDEERRRLVMYFHGAPAEYETGQASAVAISRDGISFTRIGGLIGRPYFRVFRRDEWYYAIAIPGWLYRSRDGLTGFEKGPLLFDEATRHFAVLDFGPALDVFYSVRGDEPERILVSRIEGGPDWSAWRASPARLVLEPETEYEGADLPVEPSAKGRAQGRVRQLRDPCIYREHGRVYLLYSIAGESGIAIAEIVYGVPKTEARI